MTPPRVGVAILGSGFGRVVHEPGFTRLADEGVHVVVRTGRDDDWRAAIARDDVDLVSITTPPFLHREQALAAIEAGKAVLCEKPLALDGAEARELAEAAEHAGVPTLVDFEYREQPSFRRAHTLVRDGAIGAVERVAVRWRLPARTGLSPSWKDRADLGGGTLLSLGVHAFDYLAWLAAPVARVRAELYLDSNPDRTADHGCRGDLELENGVPVSFDLCSIADDRHGHFVEVQGSDATLTLANDRPYDYLGAFELAVDGEPVPVDPVADDEDARLAPFVALACGFVRAVRDGGHAKPDFAAGLRAQLAVDAAHASHHTSSGQSAGV